MASCRGGRVKEESSKRLSVADWKRPAGPIDVWRIVDLDTGGLRFSIQDIPEDRHDEAIKHMCDYFVADEATCKALKLKDDPDAVEDFRQLWDYLLRKRMSVGAFKLEKSDKLGELAGVNILFVFTDETERALANFTTSFKSPKATELLEFLQDISEKADVREVYGVDKYLCGLGCSVKPVFRGHNLGFHLLQTRDDIGRKYGIAASSTLFTGPASQKQAERAGYEVAFTQLYEKVLNVNGEALFPGIDAKTIKIMMKELR